MTQAMIELRAFSVRYRGSGTQALDSLDLEVKRGQCVLIAGPTGCGKTTLLRCLAGLMHREGGVEISGGAEVNGSALDRVNRSEFAPRVGILFQNPDDQITGHTPREEISFGLENLGFSIDEVHSRTDEALAEIELSDKADDAIETLSGGQKQRVAAAAVIAMHPDLLLLDEPISNLDWRGRSRLIALLEKLKSAGMTIVICSHENEAIRTVADRAVRMQGGRIVEQGSSEILMQSPQPLRKQAALRDADPLVELRGVQRRFGREGFELGPLDLVLRPGEIVALLGPNGGGKTTLISLLAGILKPDNGSISYFGKRLRRFKRHLLRGIGYVGQNPDLMLHHSSVRNEMASRPRYLRIHDGRQESVDKNLVQYDLGKFSERHPFSLSQGQRQRLALGAATAGGADLVLVDEPTTGQDSKQITAIQDRLNAFAAGGAAVLFSTHNFNAAAACANRVVVLADGRIRFDGSFEQLTEDRTLLAELDYLPSEVQP